ncbi:MAG: RNA polymerase sigma-70 factor [Phormidesmis sp.]
MNKLVVFNEYRPLLFAIAYRMLGSISDAEDMIQEAWIRWQSSKTVVRSPKAFLSSLITRLCIDQLRSAKVKRERYFGTWLPEPIITETIDATSDHAELSESLSYAFLTLLECLSPTERAVYLLREVFDYDYPQIASTVGKSTANCRQIVCRARQHLKQRKPALTLSIQQKERAIEQFLTCWTQGDVQGLISLMKKDVTFWSDGGGKTTAVSQPLLGHQKVARFLIAIRRSRLIPAFSANMAYINEQPGILNTAPSNQAQSTFSFEFSHTRIQSIFAVVNPDKLPHL